MHFKISPKIIKQYPDLKIGIIVAQNINNTENSDVVKDLLIKQQEKLSESLNLESLSKHPYITSWQEAYRKFGANPKDYLSSVENLSKRILKGGAIKHINNLVDICNLISIKYLLPIKSQDLDKLSGDIELTFATGQEEPVILIGQKEAKSANSGEIIYKNSNNIISRYWNWKDADWSKITDNTKNAIFIIEALDPVSLEIIKSATSELALLIKKYCNAQVYATVLDSSKTEVNLDNKDQFITGQEQEQEIKKLIIPANIYQIIKTDHEQLEHKKHDSKEHEVRIEKAEKLKELSIEPWPESKEITATTQEVKSEFQDNNKNKEYIIAGRLMSIRSHGKTIFADLQDQSGKLQFYIRKETVGENNFNFFNEFIDIGDIIWCKGISFKTKMGEITLDIKEFKLLSKCLHPLPEKFHGIADVEIKYRQRYLDLITDPETRERFIKRSLLIRAIRDYLDSHDYIEVETPMLHPIAGGAAARPFVTHHNALDSDFYLRIAPELYLKRLVIGGIEKVYEINRNFRNEGISTRHNPEFTMLEFYTAYKDYHFIMSFVEDLLRYSAKEISDSLKLPFGDYLLDFSLPFERLSIKDAVKLHGNLTDLDLSEDNINITLKKHCVKIANKNASLAEKIFALFEEIAEPKLIQPTFIIDFPIEVSPLAKRDKANPNIAARFELFVAGMELANGFNELNDPFDQAERFKEQLKAFASGDEEAHQYDADYILALEYGLPPTVGVGIGIDRLTMLLTNTTSIKEVILFPTLKKLKE